VPAAQPDRLPFEPEMILVPAVLFLMGTSDGQVRAMQDHFDWAADFGAGLTGSAFQWEQPQHGVALPAFEIARHPVTNAQYAAFLQATGQAAPAHWNGERCPPELADHPLVQVNWHEAQAFAAWLRKQIGQAYRLPSEAEWERAARGDDLRLWPWGDVWDPSLANWNPAEKGSTSPVGRYSPDGDSPFGCADMAGNVWEWCSSQYRKYPFRADDGREKLRGRKQRVIRGGSWSVEHPGYLRCAARVKADPRDHFEAVGFRLARTPSSP
jgi:formylglycine-generating enzyme required for sulfatase activity